VRAFKKNHQFEDKYCALQDTRYLSRIINNGLWGWYETRMVSISYVIIGYYYIYCIYHRGELDAVIMGVLIGYMTSIQWKLMYSFDAFTELENYMISFDRCLKMLDIPQEAQPRKPIPVDENGQPWISKGHIKFDNFSLKYRPDTEVVIKNISADIKPGEKIGVVGRTGAGKSTICLALCRVIEAMTGKIEIDGVDISQVGLHDLRERITIIPQEPLLFNNTLKFNLDPEDKCADDDIKRVLEAACLGDLLTRDGNGLDFKVTEKGSNLSAGEKALICICRAVLRKNKVVLMDEATASIDVNTEATIQKLILAKFGDATVITVAHRLNTIMHSDRILVLSQGEIAEFDTPINLQASPDSEYSKLLSQFNQ